MTFGRGASAIEALRDMDLETGHNDFVALLGPSGCGKSTLLRIVSDLLEPTTGEVTVLGGSARAARQGRRIGFVFQRPTLMRWRTVIENVSLPLEIGPPEVRSAPRMAPVEALELVGLSEFTESYPYQLSGGMQQRVSIARALVTAPDVLLMDEPFGALDEITREHLNEQLLQVWRQTEMTILFVTHSIPEAAFLANRVVVMSPRPGRVVEVVELDRTIVRSSDYRHSDELAANARRLRTAMDMA